MQGGEAQPAVTQPPASLLGPQGKHCSSQSYSVPTPPPPARSDGAWQAEHRQTKVTHSVPRPASSVPSAPMATACSRPQASVPPRWTDR